GLLLVTAVAVLVRTLQMHVAGLSGVGRLFVVVAFTVIAIGLWTGRNGSRIFLFFLLLCDALSSLVALFLYALRQSHYRLAGFLVLQFCVAALLMWYLQRASVRRTFGGASAWPTTIKTLVLAIFTVL